MAYYQAPQERPRHVKRFLTVRDIEDAAASGCREIVHVDDLVITDAAREAAQDLGVAIVKPDPAKSAAAATATTATTAAASSTASPASAQAAYTRAAPVPARAAYASPASPSAPVPTSAAATRGVMPGMPAPAFSPPAHATFDGHPLVEELARAIRARWQPVQRRQRQLLA